MIQTTINNEPCAYVTVNRSRIKNYGKEIYLKSGTNFEIELWNPKSNRLLVKIEIDGKSIYSDGLVINPGQRVYLERWINEPKKFLFSTYDAENSNEGLNAIKNNGNIVISFHDEYHPIAKQLYRQSFRSYASNTPSHLNISSSYSSNLDSTMNSTLGGRSFNDNPLDYFYPTSKNNNSLNTIETGRTEKGENSSQKFSETSGNFNSYTTKIIEWNILPESRKPVEIDKIRSYCNCGIRVRNSSWKFCPSCGEKI